MKRSIAIATLVLGIAGLGLALKEPTQEPAAEEPREALELQFENWGYSFNPNSIFDTLSVGTLKQVFRRDGEEQTIELRTTCSTEDPFPDFSITLGKGTGGHGTDAIDVGVVFRVDRLAVKAGTWRMWGHRQRRSDDSSPNLDDITRNAWIYDNAPLARPLIQDLAKSEKTLFLQLHFDHGPILTYNFDITGSRELIAQMLKDCPPQN